MNFPTTAKCADTFTFDGMYLHQFRSSVTSPGSWNYSPRAYNGDPCTAGNFYFINYHIHVVFSERLPLLFTPQYSVLKIKRAKIPKCQVQEAMFQENLFLYQFNFSLNLKNKGVGLTSDHYVKWDSSSSNYCSRIQDPGTPCYSWQ